MNKSELNEHKGFRDLSDDFKEYLNLRIQLARLNITAKVASTLANLISVGMVILFAVLFLLFLSIGLALWAGRLFDDSALGFISVAGLYFIIGLIIFQINKKSAPTKMTDMFIKEFSNDDDDDSND